MEPSYAPPLRHPTFPAHSVILAVRPAGLEAGFAQLERNSRVQVVVIIEDNEEMERKQQVTELGEIGIFGDENNFRMFSG